MLTQPNGLDGRAQAIDYLSTLATLERMGLMYVPAPHHLVADSEREVHQYASGAPNFQNGNYRHSFHRLQVYQSQDNEWLFARSSGSESAPRQTLQVSILEYG